MFGISTLGALLSVLLVSTALAEELKIDVVSKPETCDLASRNMDKLSMHYDGFLQSADGGRGTSFDSSRSRGRPFEFTIGRGQVIPGWEQGLLDMCVGEKRVLTIPASLGYGQRAMGPIPAGSTLIFDVELLAIKNRKPAAAADAAPPTASQLVEQAIKKNHVVVFSKTYCGYSRRAKDLIASIPEKRSEPTIFELDTLDNGEQIQEYLLQKTGQRTVPNVFIGQKHIGGSDRLAELHEKGELVTLLIATDDDTSPSERPETPSANLLPQNAKELRSIVNSAKFLMMDRTSRPSGMPFLQAGAGLVVVLVAAYSALKYFTRKQKPSVVRGLTARKHG